MGKNQAYKAMQRARLGSSSAAPDEVEDGMLWGLENEVDGGVNRVRYGFGWWLGFKWFDGVHGAGFVACRCIKGLGVLSHTTVLETEDKSHGWESIEQGIANFNIKAIDSSDLPWSCGYALPPLSVELILPLVYEE
ncbi:hypothetical protein Droror1_Dr00026935 [Drosera rotundifolia]